MYVRPSHQRRGIARALLAAIESRAVQLGYRRLRLETGRKQPEAIALYRSAGFEEMPCYPPYDSDPESVCFSEALPQTGSDAAPGAANLRN